MLGYLPSSGRSSGPSVTDRCVSWHWILTLVRMTAYGRHPGIDSGPAMEAEPPDAPPARLVHSAECDQGYPKPSSDSYGPPRTDPRRGVVGPGGMDWRHEQGISPGALSGQCLDAKMGRPGSDSLGLCPTMHAIGPDRRVSCHHYDQPARLCDADNSPQQCPPFLLGCGIMPKNHAGSGRQPPECKPQSVAHPLVGHQPARGNGVTTGHAAAYSARHDC